MTLQQEYRERFQEGKIEGIKEGRKEGKIAGLKEGRKEGKREGIQEGKIVGKVETLYEELHLAVAEIAEKLDLSADEVQKIVDTLVKDE